MYALKQFKVGFTQNGSKVHEFSAILKTNNFNVLSKTDFNFCIIKGVATYKLTLCFQINYDDS